MLPETKRKYTALKQNIEQLESVAVAFSGGVDSSLLAWVCCNVLGSDSLAITFVSPLLPKKELDEACKVASQIGIRHILYEENAIIPEVKDNSVDRCFYCKKNIFEKLIMEAEKHGIVHLVDGSNDDDLSDYRPGMRALQKLNIKSPLQDVGLTKKEIREISEVVGLTTGQKPAYACLASRIPYGEDINLEKLERIEKAETYLFSIGFSGVRVRNHDMIARIEVASAGWLYGRYKLYV